MLNFEFPTKTEDYIHRIGRTGRAGAKGQAVTYMSAADASHAVPLVKILKESGLTPAEIPKELKQMAKLMKGQAAATKPKAAAAGGSSSGGGGAGGGSGGGGGGGGGGGLYGDSVTRFKFS